MCDFSNGLKFCKCGSEAIRYRDADKYRTVGGASIKIHNRRNEKIPLMYVWKLYRYAGKVENPEMGRYQVPTQNIGNGLDEEWIVLNLNLSNCFDFEYIPQERDNLTIEPNINSGPYISFVYRNGEWTIGHFNAFNHNRTRITTGKVKEIEE